MLALCAVATMLMGGSVRSQSTGTVQGRVVDEHGTAVSGARVEIRSLDGTIDAITVATATDGAYGLGTLPPGLYSVTAGTVELASDMYRVRVRPGRRVAVNFTLARGRRDASWLTELADREAASRAFTSGLAASQAGNFVEAVTQFTRAVDRRPTCAACFYNLAVAHVDLEQYQQAEAAFKRVVELTPEYAAAYYGLASIYTRLDRPVDADAARGEATRLALAELAARQDRLRSALNDGIAALDAGHFDKARRQFESLLSQDSGFSEPYFWLGMSLRELNEPARAASAFQTYLTLDSDGEFADRARDALTRLGRE